MRASITLSTLLASCAATLLLAGCAAAPGGVNGSGAAGAEPGGSTAEQALTGHLSIAAAASLEPAFRELTARFTDAHPGVTIDNVSYDGSSTLAEQILGGAPFDVFASADERNMMKVVDQGLTVGDPVAFATSSLEIAVAPGNPLGITTLADLARGNVIVVMCAPEVPCGAASHALLDHDGVALAPASEEQNVTAVLTKVASGEADAGLVYRSDVLRSDGGVVGIEIPGAADAAGSYMVASLRDARSTAAARAFVEFLGTDEAVAVLTSLGFGAA